MQALRKHRLVNGWIKKDEICIRQVRLMNSDIDEQSMLPIILPRDHKFTHLVILDCHKGIQHLKVGATLAELRSKFCVPKGRQ